MFGSKISFIWFTFGTQFRDSLNATRTGKWLFAPLLKTVSVVKIVLLTDNLTYRIETRKGLLF